MVQEKARERADEGVDYKAEADGYSDEKPSAKEHADYLLKDVLGEKKQSEGNADFRPDFEKELAGTDDRALAVFKGEKHLNSYDAKERKEVLRDVVEGFNKLGYEGRTGGRPPASWPRSSSSRCRCPSRRPRRNST